MQTYKSTSANINTINLWERQIIPVYKSLCGYLYLSGSLCVNTYRGIHMLLHALMDNVAV